MFIHKYNLSKFNDGEQVLGFKVVSLNIKKEFVYVEKVNVLKKNSFNQFTVSK